MKRLRVAPYLEGVPWNDRVEISPSDAMKGDTHEGDQNPLAWSNRGLSKDNDPDCQYTIHSLSEYSRVI